KLHSRASIDDDGNGLPAGASSGGASRAGAGSLPARRGGGVGAWGRAPVTTRPRSGVSIESALPWSSASSELFAVVRAESPPDDSRPDAASSAPVIASASYMSCFLAIGASANAAVAASASRSWLTSVVNAASDTWVFRYVPYAPARYSAAATATS